MAEKLLREKVKINGVSVNLVHSGSTVFAKNNVSTDIAKNSKSIRKLADEVVRF